MDSTQTRHSLALWQALVHLTASGWHYGNKRSWRCIRPAGSVADKQFYVALNFHNHVVFLSSLCEIMTPIKAWAERLSKIATEKNNLQRKTES